MSTKTTALLFASALMFTAACDSEDVADPAERAAETAGLTDAADLDGPHARGHHTRRSPAERLCGKIECTDEQVGAIADLFAGAHDEGERGDHEARKAQMQAKHAELAEAFRSDSFDVDTIAELHGERGPSKAEHVDRGVDLLVGLHGVLTPEQRGLLATELEERGPGLVFGHHGKRGKRGKRGKHHGKHDGKHDGERGEHDGKRGERGKHHGDHAGLEGEGDPSQHLARRVEHFCEAITCSEAQVSQLTATFEGVHEAHRDAREAKPDFSELAAAFRADTLDADLVRSQLLASKDGAPDHARAFGEVASEIHAILTPEQRAIVADRIAEGGLHAVMGKGRGHGKKHGRKGHPGDAPCEDDEQ